MKRKALWLLVPVAIAAAALLLAPRERLAELEARLYELVSGESHQRRRLQERLAAERAAAQREADAAPVRSVPVRALEEAPDDATTNPPADGVPVATSEEAPDGATTSIMAADAARRAAEAEEAAARERALAERQERAGVGAKKPSPPPWPGSRRGLEAYQRHLEEQPRAPAVIQGRVVKAADEQPVADAAVTLHDRRFYDGRNRALEVGRTATDDAGGFLFDAIPSGAYDLLVVAAGYRMEHKTEVMVAEHGNLELRFRLVPASLLEGRVLSALGDEGAPLAEARVEVYQFEQRLFPPVVTDADGRFTIDLLAAGEYVLVVYAAAHAPQRRLVRPGPEPVEFTLQAEARLEGHVYHLTKEEPVVRFRVRAVRFDGAPVDRGISLVVNEMHDVSDETGAFAIGQLTGGGWGVEVFHEDYGTVLVERFALKPGSVVSDIEVFLDQGAVLTGDVADKETGAPIPFAQVAIAEVLRIDDLVLPIEVSRELTTETDRDGRFRLPGLPAGTVRIWVVHEQHSRSLETLHFEPGEQKTTRFVLSPKGGRLQGGAWDAAGKPIADLKVVAARTTMDLAGQAGDYVTFTMTDPDGRFLFAHLPKGTYYVELHAVTDGQALPPGETWRVVDLNDGETQELAFGSPDPPNIRGRLLEGDQPVQGWTLYLVRANDPAMVQIDSVKTDAEGAFAFAHVPPGDYVIINYSEGSAWTVKQPVSLSAAQPAVEIEIRLPASGLRLALVGPDGAAFAAGGSVLVQVGGAKEDAASFDELLAGFVTLKDLPESGVVELRGLAPGRYRLRLMPEGMAYAIVEDVMIEAERMTELETLALVPEIVLEGAVATPEKKPVTGALFTLRDQWGRWLSLVSPFTTNDQGRYRVRGLSAAPYTLIVTADGFAPYMAPYTPAVGPGEREQRDITMMGGASLLVKVTNGSEQPVAGAQVRVFLPDGTEIVRQVSESEVLQRRTVTDGTGLWRMASLEGGAYRLRVSHPDFEAGEADVTVAPGGETTKSVALTPKPPPPPAGDAAPPAGDGAPPASDGAPPASDGAPGG